MISEWTGGNAGEASCGRLTSFYLPFTTPIFFTSEAVQEFNFWPKNEQKVLHKQPKSTIQN